MKRRIVALLLAATVAMLGAPGAGAAPTSATTTTRPPDPARRSAIDQQLSSLREQVAEASHEEAEVLDRLDEIGSNKRSLDRQVTALDTEIAGAESDLDVAAERLGGLTGDLQRAETKYAAIDADLSGARTDLRARAVSAYVHQPSAQLASVLLERQTFRQLAAARSFLSTMVEAQAASVERYRVLRQSIDDERAGLVVLRDEAAAQRELVATRRSQLVAVRTRQDGLRTQAAAEAGRQDALLREVRSKVKDYERQIAELKKESDAIAALLRSRQRNQAGAVAASGVLLRPVSGAVTSTFGMRTHPIFKTQRLHTGVDFAAATGTAVLAAADGTVVLAGERGGYGNAVLIDHGANLATLSAHLSKVSVSEGTSVRRGQIIGYAGSTGYATGPHLHFEVRVAGNPVDPMRYL